MVVPTIRHTNQRRPVVLVAAASVVLLSILSIWDSRGLLPSQGDLLNLDTSSSSSSSRVKAIPNPSNVKIPKPGETVRAETITKSETHSEVQKEQARPSQPQTTTQSKPNQVVANTTAPVIGHAISLIKCQKASTVRGMMDALVILRHSIHQNSIHANPNSKYSYQMIAIIHKEGCGDPSIPVFLEKLGYKAMIVDTPVQLEEIENDWYRNHVESENCCGSKEFIKLYAYTLTEYPIVVHWDLDVAVLQPLDDLYDAMLYDANSPEGKAARQRLRIQRPQTQKLPDRIDAFVTRDVTSASPWERVQAVQGGFVVARPSGEHLEIYKQFIKKGNYTPGRGDGTGWDGLGYGGFQGAMAYQGVLAYFYDIVYPGHHVELDVCRWNQVVADVIWRGPFEKSYLHQCRDYPPDGNFTANTPENGQCEDCRITPIEETMTVHYTACKKPWECRIPYPRVPRAAQKAHTYRLQELTNITTCGKLFRKYFDYRADIEQKIAEKAGESPPEFKGEFHPEYFNGYCDREGGYQAMNDLPDDLTLKDVYGF